VGEVGAGSAGNSGVVRPDVPDSRESYIEADELGSGFWKTLIGIVIAVGIGAVLVFWLLSSAWAR
jgi:hypothetical protein